MIKDRPRMRRQKRAKKSDRGTPMKGRALTSAEFERMLDAAPLAVGEAAAASWQHLLRGLWLSGLRLGEAMLLAWDGSVGTSTDQPTIRVVETGERIALRIPAEAEKGNRDRILPIVPEFARFLDETPSEQRTGWVFEVEYVRTTEGRKVETVSEKISTIGQYAAVVVIGDAAAVEEPKALAAAQKKPGKRKAGRPRTRAPLPEKPPGVKFASAHDLRRSFGDRWARLVMPAVLQTLMRHESIETTLRYYVSMEAESVMEQLDEIDAKLRDGRSAEKK